MLLTLRTLVIVLAAALAGGAAVVGVSQILSVSGDNGSDYGLDANANGKFDWLVVEATIDLPEAGNWNVGAGLFTSSSPVGGSCGGPYPVPLRASPAGILPSEYAIAWTYEQYFFPSGTQTVRMAFQGTDIFRSGVAGPYFVRATLSLGGYPCIYCLYEFAPVPGPGGAYLQWNYTTQAYRATDFEEPFRPAYFTGAHSDVAVDADHDGLYDFLELQADVRVNSAGTYSLSGYLSSTSGPMGPPPVEPVVYAPIAYGYRDVTLAPGDTSVFLRFRGDQIRMAGVDGPWNFSLTMYGPTNIMYWNVTYPPLPIASDPSGPSPPAGGDAFAPIPIVYPEILCGTTSAYSANAFDDTVELLRFTGNFSEIAQDWDGDGLYDALTIRAEVNVYVRAGFDVRGTLRSGDGTKEIALAGSQTYLPEDIGWVDVLFPGPAIRSSGIDGPYEVILSIAPSAGGFDPTTTYMTRAYRATDFAVGYSNRTGYWIGDLAVRATGGSSLGIYFSVVRGNDLLTYVIEDMVTTSVIDAAGTTVWSVGDKVYLPSGGSSQSFAYAVDNLAGGTYTILVALGSPDRPVDQRSISVTL